MVEGTIFEEVVFFKIETKKTGDSEMNYLRTPFCFDKILLKCQG